jgi:hypothetical protein
MTLLQNNNPTLYNELNTRLNTALSTLEKAKNSGTAFIDDPANAQVKDCTDPLPTNYAVRIESTIGIGGTGLIDAIPEDSIKAQYKKEYAYFAKALHL